MVRARARALLFQILQKTFWTEDGKRILADTLKGMTVQPPLPQLHDVPYPEIARTADLPAATTRPIFITARFRTGSTMLWNIFRNTPGCTAYYEPLNERRWFDAAVRGERVDESHGVADYWREYEGLDNLGRWYKEEWISRRLYMGADAFDPDLFSYIDALIQAARSRPVLQFNRVDFRLPWLRRHFPEAIILHLYRHPRDQWMSTLWGRDFPRNGTVAEFERQDGFYLLTWARDLSYHFPLLDPRTASHPYELFYYLWRLSYAFGRDYADISVCYEHLCDAPHEELKKLFVSTQVGTDHAARLVPLVSKRASGSWRRYADEEWFRAIESRCDERLERVTTTGERAAGSHQRLAKRPEVA